MNSKLALSGLLSAALLAGCGSAPKLTTASGEWEDLPFTHVPPSVPVPRAEPVVLAIPAAAPEPVQPLITTEVPAPVPPKVHRPRKIAPKPLASPVPDQAGKEAAQPPAHDTKCTAD